MKFAFTKTFEKHLSGIKDEKLLAEINNVVVEVGNASSLMDITNLKKLKGDKTAYRIRTGSYRIGFFFEGGVVIFDAFLHRKDIYRKFP